jgi:ParB/RepB/Spo0J family partition protein
MIPMTALRESPTNPRKHFDEKALAELMASIREHGILEPLVVRPSANGDARNEIVCGARRFRAAKLLGLAEVPAILRDMTDEKVRVIQLVENGGRADLSPIEEAEAYAALEAEGMDVRAIAKTLGREPSMVARRLPLMKLGKSVKSALASGLITARHAELIARIPDASRHDEALSRFLVDVGSDDDAKPALAAVPLNVARSVIEEYFMTTVSDAIFDPEDPELSPLGACSKCPHLAGNNPDLFGDITKKAVCTNPKDFRLKTENHLKRLKEAGHTVLLSKNDLKRAFPYANSDQLGKDFLDLETVCVDDPKRRRYEQLLGRGEKLKIVHAFKDGRVRKLYPAKEVRPALIAAGHAFAKKQIGSKPLGAKPPESGAQRLKRLTQEAVAKELAQKLRTVKLTDAKWWDLFARVATAGSSSSLAMVFGRHGYPGTPAEFAKHEEAIIRDCLMAMKPEEKRALALDLMIPRWGGEVGKHAEPLYAEILKLAGVDPVAIAKRIETEAKLDKGDAKRAGHNPAQTAAKDVFGRAKKRTKK